MLEENCLFCKIIRGEIPCRKVFETENTLAFLDISPMTAGHTVVVPKKHYYNLLNIPEEEIKPFFLDLKKISEFLKERLKFDGFNILQNNFPAAGQVVDHFHYHIIPRRKGGHKLPITKDPALATDEALNEMLKKLS